LEFDLTNEYIHNLFLNQDQKCNLTGWEINLFNENQPITASLDRIDSKKGYIKNNVQWLHKDINCIKLDFSQGEFIRLCKDVANFNS
jgi:hypothetical protein